MSKPVDHLLASMKNLRLKDDERNDTREVLEARIRFPHAFRILDAAASEVSLLPSEKQLLRIGLTEAIHRGKRVSGFDIFAAFSLKRFVALFSAVLIVFSTGGGVLAYAAEDALPGEALYPIKVSLSEPAIALFHRTPQARARWAEKKLERRLREAEKLSLREFVDPEIEETMILSMEYAEQEVERNTIALTAKDRRQEFGERLRHMKERQRGVVGRFKEKRMKKREFLLPQEEMNSTSDDDRNEDAGAASVKSPILLSGSVQIRRERAFSSSMQEERLSDEDRRKHEDDRSLRLLLDAKEQRSKQAIPNVEDSVSSAGRSFLPKDLERGTKNERVKDKIL